jgi:hypothetical protein
MFSKYTLNKSLNLNKIIINRSISKAMGKPRVKTLNAFKKSKESEEIYYYINDIKMAQIVLKHLSNDLPKEKSIIFESSPGNGVLTRLLLSSGAPLVRVFEDDSNHLNKLMVRFVMNLNKINEK